ncbi:hypothetical protein VPHF95_0050 [Vibrio phage F95]
MASFRTHLTEDNMDIVMFLVRELDKNPSEVLNMVISNPQLIYDARSGINGKEDKKGWSEKT